MLFMMQDLIILGLLMAGPKHGYQIKKLIKEMALTYTAIDNTSIYYPLNRMKKEGLLTEQRAKSKTGGLEKFVYSITAKGRKTFKRSLYKNFLTLQRPFINTDISLYFLKYMDKNMVVRRVKQRLRWLKRIETWLKDTKSKIIKQNKGRELALIIQHNLELIKAEIKFSSHIARSFKC